MKLHNKEGHNGFSTISGRDGYTVKKLEVVHKSQQKCEICDKTILKSNFNSHLNSEGHKTNYTPLQIINSLNNQIQTTYNLNSNALIREFN
jgi:hypothetical protein